MSLIQQLTERAANTTSPHWRPHLFCLALMADREQIEELLDRGSIIHVVDTIADQLTDWLKASQPGRKWTTAALAAESTALLADRPLAEYGKWVFFPWSGTLCHILPEAEFRFLRSARNRHKISAAEQEVLATKTIAIVGLSVGLSIATTLALEGIGRRFRLADFDALGLSNLNRLRAGVPDLGTNKAILAARQLFELDPYLQIDVFPSGVTPDNLAEFLASPLDLLIEECDDLGMKVRLRTEARRRRIPVMMDTSDRGLLDVERFDREPDRPLLHGLMGELRVEVLDTLSAADKVPIALRILDAKRLSVGMRASLPEIGRTTETWPQLASAVALGGGITADAARRLLLGEFTESGRYFVDVAEIVRDGARTAIEPPASQSIAALHVPVVPRRPAPQSDRLSLEEVRFLVEHAILAPSGGNSQPWRFEWQADELLGFIVPERTQALIDFEFRGCYVALGAAAENVSLAAAELGLSSVIEPCPDPANPKLAFRARFSRTSTFAREPELFEQIPLRVTNRKTGPRISLSSSIQQSLQNAAADCDGKLHLLNVPADLDDIAALMGRCDRFLLLTQAGHRETFRELRFDPSEVRRTRDGLDVNSLEVSAAGRAALEILSDWPVMQRVREVGGGSALEDLALRAVAGSTAVGLLRISGNDRAAFVRGGRAVQRLWLTANRLGLTFHPWTALPFLLARVENGGPDVLTPEEWSWFSGLRDGYHRMFPADADSADILLFRLGQAEGPSARSLRRSIDDVFRVHAEGDRR